MTTENKDFKSDIPIIDFDTLADLAENDPDAFEQQRKLLIEEFIASAPEQHKQRLRGLQFEIDSRRRLAKNPMDACVMMYQMMMDMVTKPGGFIDTMESLQDPEKCKQIEKSKANKKAKIYSFEEA